MTTTRYALITGGSTGIGLATAKLLEQKGYRVAITGQNADNLGAAKKALGGEALVLRADARSLADATRVADEVQSRFGKLDLVFLNAGVAKFAPLDAFDEAFYDDLMDVNVKGPVFQLQKALPLLGAGASVVFNTSVVAHKGIATASVYSATKGALSAIVRSFAAELAPRGVRVNAVSPGPIETPIYPKLGMPAEALSGFKAGMTANVPLKRFGGADEVAHTVAFLASPEAGYVTGVEIAVDGGLASV